MYELLREGVALTKTNAKDHAQEFINMVLDGEQNALESLVTLEYLSQVIDEAKSKIREIATDSMYQIGEEARIGFTIKGVQVQLREVGVKYQFDNSQDWLNLQKKEASASKERKELEEMLKTLKSPIERIDTQTGEVTTLMPPVKTSKTSVVITLSK
jgi:hypothetical protein